MLVRRTPIKRKKPLASNAQPKRKKGSKFRAVKAEFRDRMFDSKLERDRAIELTALMDSGHISDLKFQVTYTLSKAQITYKPDFVYTEDGREIAEDAKGIETDRFKIIKKLWKAYGPCPLRITKRRNGRGAIHITQTVYPPITDEN